MLVTALDEVAWLLNLRGADISYNPVFVSYVLVEADSATLYVDSAKVIIHILYHWLCWLPLASPDKGRLRSVVILQ